MASRNPEATVVSDRELRQWVTWRGRPKHPVLRMALAVSGCDKVNAALTLTCLLQAMSPAPELVLQVGIAGGFAVRLRRPSAGDLVIATQEAYSDTGASSPTGWLSASELGLPIAVVDGAEVGAGCSAWTPIS